MERLEKELKQTVRKIFKDYPIHTLSDFEKREMIYDYLTEELSYDFELLDKIRDCAINKTKITRNPIQELYDAVINKKGICNSISQYYKLLLEQVGIKSYCVICDDGTEVKHQLNLVYDKERKSYSFDDITSVIVKRGNKEDYFDYDLDSARRLNQGNVNVFHGESHFILPEDYINYLIGREKSPTPTLEFLPENIASVENKTSKKR